MPPPGMTTSHNFQYQQRLARAGSQGNLFGFPLGRKPEVESLDDGGLLEFLVVVVNGALADGEALAGWPFGQPRVAGEAPGHQLAVQGSLDFFGEAVHGGIQGIVGSLAPGGSDPP